MNRTPFISRINIWFVYMLFTLVIGGIVMYSAFLIKELRVRETNRIKVFAKAMQIQQANSGIDSETQNLLLAILEENDQLPVIVTDKNKKPLLGEGTVRNIPERIVKDSVALKKFILKMESNYEPFELTISKDNKQLVFFDNSQLLKTIQYFPALLGFFVLTYLLFSIWFMRTIKKKDEGFLWAGLAKETAHQIGTPLSSMIGWIEVMKMETPDVMGVSEIEKDVVRLKTISERFSKIGSVPELNDYNLMETIQQNYDYLKTRISSKIDFKLQMSSKEILVPHNRILMSWVIENLVKNAVDAMKGIGKLDIVVSEKNNSFVIDFKDSGVGMSKKQVRKVFKPGYSTKKRGWGLGLSLAKRVVEDYHNGILSIPQTGINKGTTFRIVLKLE